MPTLSRERGGLEPRRPGQTPVRSFCDASACRMGPQPASRVWSHATRAPLPQCHRSATQTACSDTSRGQRVLVGGRPGWRPRKMSATCRTPTVSPMAATKCERVARCSVYRLPPAQAQSPHRLPAQGNKRDTPPGIRRFRHQRHRHGTAGRAAGMQPPTPGLSARATYPLELMRFSAASPSHVGHHHDGCVQVHRVGSFAGRRGGAGGELTCNSAREGARRLATLDAA